MTKLEKQKKPWKAPEVSRIETRNATKFTGSEDGNFSKRHTLS